MNRGLALALLILAFALTIVGADAMLLSDAISENEIAFSPAAPTRITSVPYDTSGISETSTTV